LKTGTVTLNAKSTLGATTTSTLTVEKNTKGSIKFEDEAYFCNEGEYINTKITAYGSDSNPLATVKSYTSEDTSIATITQNTEVVANCANCVSVIINCKKAGIVRLKATSSLGASTTSTLYVEENDKGSISFGGSSINCKKGEKINTIITAKGTNQTQPATVRSYAIQDTSIATIERSTGIVVNCANCVSVEITCKKVGTTTAKAISSLGASTIIPITVEK
jgi:bacterioferritin-associated ferredoxin